MSFLDKIKQGRTPVSAFVTAAMMLTAGIQTVRAQDADTAYVPFSVNVDASVKAARGSAKVQISVTANRETVLAVPLQGPDAVRHSAQRRPDAASISVRDGKIAVGLSARLYKDAEISLHSVNGKRILRRNVSAANAAGNIRLPNLATGVYMLSVKGAEGGIAASRLTHNGGGLNIVAAFKNESARTDTSTACTRCASRRERTLCRL